MKQTLRLPHILSHSVWTQTWHTSQQTYNIKYYFSLSDKIIDYLHFHTHWIIKDQTFMIVKWINLPNSHYLSDTKSSCKCHSIVLISIASKYRSAQKKHQKYLKTNGYKSTSGNGGDLNDITTFAQCLQISCSDVCFTFFVFLNGRVNPQLSHLSPNFSPDWW